jgi:hypothetical protein
VSNPWFRLYAEFADDPKVQRMPEAMQRRLVMLFCLRCKDETFDETLQAFQWRITPEELAETKKLFLENRFIDEEWELLNWNRRQYISDSSTARVRQYRERKKRRETLHKPDINSDIDMDETGGNVTVTAPDTDTDTDTDTDSEPEQTHKPLSAGAHAKAIASRLMGLVNEDLGELVLKIAVRHPRSRMRQWTASNVAQADTAAILEAMEAEAQEKHMTMAEVGRAMLFSLDAWDDVPRDKWQFAAAIPRFYKQGDYRLPPNELPGIAPREGAKHGKRTHGTTDVSAAFRELLGAQQPPAALDLGVAGDIIGDHRAERDSGGSEGVPSLAESSDQAPDSPGVQPSAGRVQVLTQPSYPPRVQWPRRNG